MKSRSRGLFPGPRSIPKRLFQSAAGNSEYRHVLPDTNDYETGAVGWRSGRAGGGETGQRMKGPGQRPIWNHVAQTGEGGLAWDASATQAMTDRGKPQKP